MGVDKNKMSFPLYVKICRWHRWSNCYRTCFLTWFPSYLMGCKFGKCCSMPSGNSFLLYETGLKGPSPECNVLQLVSWWGQAHIHDAGVMGLARGWIFNKQLEIIKLPPNLICLLFHWPQEPLGQRPLLILNSACQTTVCAQGSSSATLEKRGMPPVSNLTECWEPHRVLQIIKWNKSTPDPQSSD